MSSRLFLHSPNNRWLIDIGEFISDIPKNWYEKISSLSGQRNYFSLHCILHAFDFYQFAVDLKQFKTPF